LIRHLSAQHFQGQIDRGIITPNQALKLFNRELIGFTQQVHKKINESATNNQSNLTDLSNPDHVLRELQNPNSALSLFVGDQIQSITNAITTQMIADDDAMQQDAAPQLMQSNQIDDATAMPDQSGNQSNFESHGIMKDAEKCAAVGVALKLADELDPKILEGIEKSIDKIDPKLLENADKMLEDAFHKVTGIDAGEMHGLRNELKEIEAVATKEFAPKLQPKESFKDDTDK
jgi:hypothetical protein